MPKKAARARQRLASPTAIIAFCISIGTAGFSVYQWWQGRNDSRIVAAIEISRNYFKETDDPQATAILLSAAGQKINAQQTYALMNGAYYLNYVAFLANNTRVDSNYLSDDIKCYMKWANDGVKNIKNQFSEVANAYFPDIEKFILINSCPRTLALVTPHSN